MEFSNLFFLYLFLPLCVGIYFLAPGIKFKNGILILFSLLFYTIDSPQYLLLLLFLTGWNYGIPHIFAKRKKLVLLFTIGVNVGLLVFFKLLKTIPFPLGISFYSFSLISYQVDIYRDSTERCGNFWQFLLFVSFFPKLVMGPITRFSQISSQLKERTVEPKLIFQGCLRFVSGLSKKILLADPLFSVYEQFSAHSSWLSAWGGGLAFMLYIYLEFSGCCDMTLGMGNLFGLSLPENFYRPYTAHSVGQFWRRWHITLGGFFKDYVYIPLGGNRRGLPRQFFHLLAVWLLTGLWHGISITFILWGLYFFVLLFIEKVLCMDKRNPSFWKTAGTFLLIYFGWIIFAAKDLPSLGNVIGKMFTFTTGGLEPALLVLRNSSLVGIVGLFVSVAGPVLKDKFSTWMKMQRPAVERAVAVTQGLLILILLALCTVSLIGSAGRPSMYAGF